MDQHASDQVDETPDVAADEVGFGEREQCRFAMDLSAGLQQCQSQHTWRLVLYAGPVTVCRSTVVDVERDLVAVLTLVRDLAL